MFSKRERRKDTNNIFYAIESVKGWKGAEIRFIKRDN
jgi:hypothetical protein